MGLGILSSDYRARFVDDQRYAGRVSDHLAGLAAAIENSHPEWRPTASELILLLPKSDTTNAIVAAGMSYGAAKGIEWDYPGPAILLYGAALNVIGSAPQIELNRVIENAKLAVDNAGLSANRDVVKLIEAATQRASFDKVSAMLRDEFAEGLRASGKYSDDEIDDIVPEIVNVTHDVRHKGLIERVTWENIVVESEGSSSDVGFMHEIDEVVFTDDKLRDLLPYASTGCAFSILRRMNDRRR